MCVCVCVCCAGGELFSRLPGLHAFLLSELHHAVTQLESHSHAAMPKASNNSTPSQDISTLLQQPPLHPSLFPILIILSRLRLGPPPERKGHTAGAEALSPARFAPLVRRCAAARHYAVRQLAARALAPLVPCESVLYTLVYLLGQLPLASADALIAVRAQTRAQLSGTSWGSEALTSSSDGAVGMAGTGTTDGNVVQGRLMQLEALLRHNVTPGVCCLIALTRTFSTCTVNAWLTAL